MAERLLRARLLRDERDEIIGDLQEQFVRRAADGPLAARWWYWRQTLALIVSFSVHRRDLVSRAHERTRGRWGAGNLMADVRYAWRSLVHSRSFAIVALLTLTAGIGLSTAVFSLVSSVLARSAALCESRAASSVSANAGPEPAPQERCRTSPSARGSRWRGRRYNSRPFPCTTSP